MRVEVYTVGSAGLGGTRGKRRQAPRCTASSGDALDPASHVSHSVDCEAEPGRLFRKVRCSLAHVTCAGKEVGLPTFSGAMPPFSETAMWILGAFPVREFGEQNRGLPGCSSCVACRLGLYLFAYAPFKLFLGFRGFAPALSACTCMRLRQACRDRRTASDQLERFLHVGLGCLVVRAVF
jgi:hypothetical protein